MSHMACICIFPDDEVGNVILPRPKSEVGRVFLHECAACASSRSSLCPSRDSDPLSYTSMMMVPVGKQTSLCRYPLCIGGQSLLVINSQLVVVVGLGALGYLAVAWRVLAGYGTSCCTTCGVD